MHLWLGIRDNMQKNVIVGLCAVIVVAVVVVAGIAVFLNKDKDDFKLPEYQKDTGTVYGNADGNCYIDSTDKKVMQKIIDGDASLEDYPFADANLDGVVNEKDIEIVDKYMDKESVTLKVLDAEDKVINVACPIDKMILLCGSNLAPLINILDISDKVVAAAYTSEKFNDIRDYPIAKGVKDGTIMQVSTKGTADDFAKIASLDLKACHFMMTEYSSMYDLDSDENVTKLNDMGIDVLRMEARDPGQDLRSMAVFGILLNKGDAAKEYQDFINNVHKQIDDALGDKKGKVGVMISSLTSNLSGQSSGYTVMLETAGGYNMADWNESTKKVTEGDTWFLDPKYASNILFLGSSSDYGGTGFKAADDTKYENLYKDHHAYTDGKVYRYSTGIPVICRIAYYAEAMNPDCFSENWAHNIHQQFVDKFFKTEYTVNDEIFFKLFNTA